MCTICGHFVREGKRASTDLYDMLMKMAHRGPDTHGVSLDGKIKRAKRIEDLRDTLLEESRIALGHSRLSIVGGRRSTGQPYTSCDGRLTLIHNGEIYNYQKLSTLFSRPHAFQTTSDSEIIVHLLEEAYRGDLLEAVQKVAGLLDGMYALAVTDGDSLAVARDPVGKKPLYYIENGPTVYFASEKKALWNGRDEPKRLYPGEILYVTPEKVEVHVGYQLQMPQIDVVDFRQAVDLYKDALLTAVEKRLSGLEESKIGVIFSGGIDSVLIANLLMREGRDIACYCTGAADSADVRAARAVAPDLGLPLKTALIDEETVEELLPEVIMNVEESGLLQVEVAIPMYLAAKMAAADGIRVMFTGQAADELFAGYPWYNGVIEEYGYLRLHEKLWEDLCLLYTDTLEREDKLTMAHSIELRAPYLDRDVIQTAMRISPKLKLSGPGDQLRKRVHRQASVELGVPAYLGFRTKDPAQSGSGIHGIIEKIAARQTGRVEAEAAGRNIERDKGSLYRYGSEEYGLPATRSYLQKIEDGIRRRFIPAYLNPEETGQAA